MLNSATLNINLSPILKRTGARLIASPFGSSLPNRAWSDVSRVYRYGFNGKEKDAETANDAYDFGARIYDGRLGRWLSVDPELKSYISLSVYQFTNNCSILYREMNGAIFDISNIANIEVYNSQINYMKEKSILFRYMYNRLEKSDIKYTISIDENYEFGGSFAPGTNTITLSSLNTYLVAQEFFHAFQFEYAFEFNIKNPDSNIELEGDYFAMIVANICGAVSPDPPFLRDLLECTETKSPNIDYIESNEFNEAYVKALDLRVDFYSKRSKDESFEMPTYTATPDKTVKPKALGKVIKESKSDELYGPRLPNGDFFSN